MTNSTFGGSPAKFSPAASKQPTVSRNMRCGLASGPQKSCGRPRRAPAPEDRLCRRPAPPRTSPEPHRIEHAGRHIRPMPTGPHQQRGPESHYTTLRSESCCPLLRRSIRPACWRASAIECPPLRGERAVLRDRPQRSTTKMSLRGSRRQCLLAKLDSR